MAGLAIATTVGMGIAQNKSKKRASEAQGRVNDAKDTFNDESREMNQNTAKKNLAFDKKMFGEQKSRDNILMKTSARDVVQAEKDFEGAQRENFINTRKQSPMKNMARSEKNILKLTGGTNG